MNQYESPTLLDQYLLFHYASEQQIDAPAGASADWLNFPSRTVALAPAEARVGTALDLGCAVGRSSFELSKTCTSVLGVDFSKSFITAADQLGRCGTLDYRRHDEAHRSTPLVARLPDGCHPERVTFRVGDATALEDGIGSFDLVHAANLICRLPEPLALLNRLSSLVNPGGYLVLTTPCTWLGEFTPPEKWPDEPTIDWLKTHLGSSFHLLETCDLPFLIRETSRKFQWTTAQGSVWRRR